MNSIRWMLSIVVLFTVACGGESPNKDLPSTYTITDGGSLFAATVDMCGVATAVWRGQGRWREWRNSDERIAKARMVKDPKWGWKVLIPPGTYVVPRDLCADEGIPLWKIILLSAGSALLLAGAIVLFILWARSRAPADHRTPADI